MNENLSVQHTQIENERGVSLYDILLVLYRQRKLITIVTLICLFLAVLLALLLTPVYQAKVSFLPPSGKDVAALNISDLSNSKDPKDSIIYEIDQEQLYHQFETQLNSVGLRKVIFDEMNLKDEFPSVKNTDEAFYKYFKDYYIVKPKASRQDDKLRSIQVVLNGEKPKQIANVLNKIVYSASKKTIEDVVFAIKEIINNKVDLLNNNIAALRMGYINRTNDTIVQLTEADKIERNIINDKIRALKHAAKLQLQDKIKRLEEAEAIAGEIGLEEQYVSNSSNLDVDVVNLFANNSRNKQKKSHYFRDDPNPLYYRGRKALRAEIKELKSRTLDDPFIPELRLLEQELIVLKQNQRVNAMSERKNNDAFIKGLRDKELELAYLNSIHIDTSKIKAVIIDQLAYPPNERLKPKRSLIVVLGGIFGFMLGILVAFMRNYLREHPVIANA